MPNYGEGLFGAGLYGVGVGSGVDIPAGNVLPAFPRGVKVDPLTTNRTTRYRFDLLDDTGRKFGVLDGVTSGSIEWNANSQVKGGGKINVALTSKAVDWFHTRIRPVLVIGGVPDTPLGVFIPTAPVDQWDVGGAQQSVELLDRTSVISQDYVDSTYSVPKNTNVIERVRDIIASTGEKVGALTASSETTSADMTWGAGTNKLTIINDLLDAAGFFALWADGNGQFRVEEYRSPKSRPVVYQMLDNSNSIYIPTLSIDRDIYSVPNKVIMTAQGSGESEAWTAVATNENPDSPFSFQSRGRWITDVQLGVEATSLDNLQAQARRRLRSLSSTQATVEVQHAPVPNWTVNDVVRFRRKPAGVDTLFTVTKTSIDFDPTSLAKSTLTEVVDL